MLADVGIEPGDRGLDEDARGRRNDLQPATVALLHELVGFAFPDEEDIAFAPPGKGVGRAARAGIQHGHAIVEAGHKGPRRIVVPLGAAGVAPRSEIIPLATTAGARVGSDDLYALGDEIRPIANVLRVALRNHEHDGRV